MRAHVARTITTSGVRRQGVVRIPDSGIGARKPAVMDIVELIPAYDHPSFISMRLACYMILHVLGGMATGGEQVRSP